MKKRKIAIITGSRAEYGHLYWIIKKVNKEPALKLQLVVTGMHLSPEFGLTARKIQEDGFPIAEKVKMLVSSDTPTAISTSIGRGIMGFSRAYKRLKPDILFVLGDRFEILSAVVAAVPFRIPVAHAHGGEATEGLIDDPIRHAITKLSHIHFTATEKYKKRVIQMGESPENVFCFGAPGLDNVYNLNLMDREALFEELGLPKEKKAGVVTYHPVTLEEDNAEFQISEILEAVKKFREVYWIFTFSNADTGGRAIIKKVKTFEREHPKLGKVFISLGQLKYLSLLKCATIMIGNSSSGLIEAPSFELPVVNIGDRQRGRIQAKNVIDVPEYKKETIVNAINKATSLEFKNSLRGMKNPYGKGNTSPKIVETLRQISLGEKLIKKRFCEFLK